MQRTNCAFVVGSPAFLAAMLLAAVPCAAEIQFQHAGNATPVSQGWTADFTGTPIVQGPTGPTGVGEFNDTENAWRLNDNTTAGRGTYTRTVAPLSYLDARSGGWQLDGRVKVTDTTAIVNVNSRQFRYIDEEQPIGAETQYRVQFTTNASGQTIAGLGGTASTVNVGTGYHDYSLRYDPVTKIASLYIDGAVAPALTTSGVSSNAFTSSLVTFGPTSTGDTGAANYALVRLSTVGASSILAGYGFDGGSPASLDISGGSTASNVTAASGLSGAGFSASTMTAFTPASGTPSTAAAALLSNAFFSYTVTPDAGQQLNLQSLFIEAGANTSPAFTGTYTASWFVRSSVDGFAADLASVAASVTGFPDADGDGVGDINLVPLLIDLSAPQFQGLTGPVEFRFYAFDNSSGAAFVRLDNVVLRGAAAAVPEPAAWAGWLATAGIACALVIGRGRRPALALARRT